MTPYSPSEIPTVVKDKIGRSRYVVFRVESDEALEISELIKALREASNSLPRESRPSLVSYEGGLGIVRCAHTDKEEVIGLLRAISTIGRQEVCVTTLGTSGTIRRAREKYVDGRH